MAESIGVISEGAGTITVKSENGMERDVQPGEQIFEGEVISTHGAGSFASVTFTNGCQMSLGADESGMVDETVYNLEFYDNADVVADIDDLEAAEKEVKEASEEGEEADVTAASAAGGAENIEDVEDLSELEATAAGESEESTQVSEAEIEERTEYESGGPLGGATGGTGAGYEPYSGEWPDSAELFEKGAPEAGSVTGDTTEAETEPADTTAPEAPSISIPGLNEINGVVISNDNTPELSGSGEEGTTIIFYDDFEAEGETAPSTGTVKIGQTEVGEDGTWSFTPEALDDGTHTFSVEAVDTAGNSTTASGVLTLMIDTVAPDVPVVESIDLTNVATPTITGSAEAGSSINVTVGENSYTVTASEDGSWSVTTDALEDGSYTVSATVTDAAGNVSDAGSGSVTIDTTAPDAPVITELGLTNDATPEITGNAESGSSVTIYDGQSELGSTTAGEDGTWSFTPETLSDGEHTISAVLTDAAGNVSGSSVVQTLVIDTAVPDVPVVESIDLSNITMPVISGTAEADSAVSVSVGENTYNVTAGEDGSWSVTAGGLTDGSYTVGVTATDAAGNVSEASHATIYLDTTSVSYMIDYDNVTVSGDVQGIEDASLYGIRADAGFDPDSDVLDLAIADEAYVTEHHKGFGVEGGHGEQKAINADEALVIDLGTTTDTVDVSLNKLAFFESGRWIAYDEDMNKVGEDSFSFFGSLFGGEDNCDYNFWGNSATLSITDDDVDGEFQYLVFTTGDGFQGHISDYFVEDVSYVLGDEYSYTMNITGVPSGDDAQTSLLIDGLDEDVTLTDADGNSVGTFENGAWSLGEDEINALSSGGQISLQVVSDEMIDPTAGPELSFTVTETSIESTMGTDMFAMADTGYGEAETVFDFDNLDSVKQIDLSEQEGETVRFDLSDVLELSGGANRLGITSSEADQSLSLDASEWQAKTDADGNNITFESDGNTYAVYASTDGDNPFDLIIDQSITIVLENE